MARKSKLMIVAVAAALMATLGATSPAATGSAPADKVQMMGTGGGWCC